MEDGDELGVYRRRPVTERLDGIGFSEAVETREQTNALTAGEFDLGRAPAEEQAIQFTVAEESYRIAQIVVTPVRAPQQVNRTGNDATNPQEAAFKVRMIMERLQAGTPFTDVAMDYSEDPESAQRGGDLGLIPVSALKRAPEALQKAVIGKTPGAVNVVSNEGMHTIVAVIAHELAGERGLTTPGVKDGITQTLKDRKEQLLRTAYLSAARGDATVVNHQARRVVESQGKVR